jgi:hypothetical protein
MGGAIKNLYARYIALLSPWMGERCRMVQWLSRPPPTVTHTPTLATFGKDGAPLFYTPIEFVTDLVAKLWYSMSKNWCMGYSRIEGNVPGIKDA